MEFLLGKELSEKNYILAGKKAFFHRYCDSGFKTKWTGFWVRDLKFIEYFAFKINDQWFLCDLPGYGYAKVSKKERESFALMIEKYATQRSNLVCFFVLIDARIPPQQLDLDFIEWLGDSNLPFVIVLTKIDKVSQLVKSSNLTLLKDELSKSWEELPTIFETSAEKRTGRKELLGFIDDTNQKLVS